MLRKIVGEGNVLAFSVKAERTLCLKFVKRVQRLEPVLPASILVHTPLCVKVIVEVVTVIHKNIKWQTCQVESLQLQMNRAIHFTQIR